MHDFNEIKSRAFASTDQTIEIRNTIFEAIIALSPQAATRADDIARSLQSIAKSLEAIAAAMTKQEEK